PAHDRAARRGNAGALGEEDRSLRGRARSHALRRLRRRDPRDHPGGVLLAPGSADRARRRLGHTLPARIRVGILSRPGARRRRIEGNDGGEMSRHVVKLPDLGEGTVSSEIVAWHVKVGDRVAEDQPMVEMSTDKAVVEMPAPVSGRVVSLGGEPGDHIAVGAELIVLETAEGAAAEKVEEKKEAPAAPKEKAAGSHPASISPQSSAADATVASSGRISMRRSIRLSKALPASLHTATAARDASRAPRPRRSAFWACAGSAHSAWPSRSATSRTSHTSRKWTSPSWSVCASTSTRSCRRARRATRTCRFSAWR